MEKLLQFKFDDEYINKYVICYYITHRYHDNVVKDFNNLIDAMQYMDDKDMWDDYYIYHINEQGYAVGWKL